MPSDAQSLTDLHFPLMGALRAFLAANGSFPKGLTSQQMMILIILDMNGPIRLTDLSKKTMVTHGTMVVAVQKMIKRGLVLKKKDPTDDRAVALNVSATGRAIPKALKKKLLTGYKSLCESLPAGNAKKLVDCFQFMAKTFKDHKRAIQ